MAANPNLKNVYFDIHKNFVHEVTYNDKETGEEKSFHSVTLPKGTVIDGMDVSGYQFGTNFVNDSKFRGENFRTIPLSKDREVRLQKSILDENGEPVLDEAGNRQRDVIAVTPEALKEAIVEEQKSYRESLKNRADHAREGADALGKADDRARAEAQVR